MSGELPQNITYLLNSVYKVLSIGILRKLKALYSRHYEIISMWIQKRESTIDNIFKIRQVVLKLYEYNRNVHMLFIDLKQDDNINQEQLWMAL